MKPTIVALCVGCFLLSGVSSAVRAAERGADQAAVVRQVTALDDAARAAYSNGDFEKMKKNLLKALALGKDAIATTPIMARVYLHLGVLYVDGLDNRAVGVRYFAKALAIRPDIELTTNMATKTVQGALAEGRRQQEPRTAEVAAPPKTTQRDRSPAKDEESDREAAEPAPRRPARAAASAEGCHGDAEVASIKKQARDEFDRLEKALAMAKDALTKESAQSDKFRKEKMDFERQLGEAKQRVTQLENETAQKEKRSVAGAQREKKEREAKEALAKEKADTDSLVLDTAQRVQQLEKEVADKDRQIAAKDKQIAVALDREKKERDSKEKLERDQQAAEARERERVAMVERARVERDKIEAGPPLPSRIPEPLHCAVPEEAQGGADLFVQCVTQPNVKAKTIVFYYRPANAAVYNAVVMDPTRRGWSRAVITANKVNGKLLQYYAEARDGRDSVAATNGQASSPNIVTIAGSSRR